MRDARQLDKSSRRMTKALHDRRSPGTRKQHDILPCNNQQWIGLGQLNHAAGQVFRDAVGSGSIVLIQRGKFSVRTVVHGINPVLRCCCRSALPTTIKKKEPAKGAARGWGCSGVGVGAGPNSAVTK